MRNRKDARCFPPISFMPDLTNSHRQFVMSAFDRFERRLTRYAARLLGDEEAARDVVQFTFLKLCEAERSTVECRMPGWLYTVCRNRAIDEIRSRSRNHQVLEKELESLNMERVKFADKKNDPATVLEEFDILEVLQKLIDRLPATSREVMELWAQGFSCPEIAELTKKKEGTIRVCLHRAFKQLRENKIVQKWIDDEGTEIAFSNEKRSAHTAK